LSARAQEADPVPRDTVGLALAGGGALGFAHVGVLLELEEMGIPIDYVAGTSIGSVVGALYAAGYSAEDILQISRETKWNELFIEEPDRRSLPYNARQRESIYSLRLGFQGTQPILEAGVSPGQSVVELLDDLPGVSTVCHGPCE
jgi:NTE family protein